MPQPTKGPRLGGSPSHQRLILANLATSLFTHGRITTTEAKAKRLRPYAERLITKAKRNDLHNRREIQKVIRDKAVVHRLVAEIGPLFENRDGGYTRITKTMPRKGDNAPMAVIELITSETVSSEADRARRVSSSKPKAQTATKSETEAKAAEAAEKSLDAAVEVDGEAPGTEAADKSVEAAEATEEAAAAAAKGGKKAADEAAEAADTALDAAAEVDEEAPGTEAADKSVEAAEAAEDAAESAEKAADKKDGS